VFVGCDGSFCCSFYLLFCCFYNQFFFCNVTDRNSFKYSYLKASIYNILIWKYKSIKFSVSLYWTKYSFIHHLNFRVEGRYLLLANKGFIWKCKHVAKLCLSLRMVNKLNTRPYWFLKDLIQTYALFIQCFYLLAK
jgi:hypothetical protein